MSFDATDAPMRTLCPACNCWVDSFGAGDDSTTVDGVAYHKACAPAEEQCALKYEKQDRAYTAQLARTI